MIGLSKILNHETILLFFCIFLFLVVSSCNKKDEITPPDQFPEWLELKITELTSGQNLCEITDVTIIDYKGKLYYNIYCGLWSCIYCELYDENGDHPTWETEQLNDFFANKKEIKTLPACE